MTVQPVDSNNNAIPALRLKNGGAHSINATDTTARNASAFDEHTKIISVYSDIPVYLKMGDSSVEATTSDHFFPDGIYYDFAIEGNASVRYTHIAVLRAGGSNGTVYISEKE